MPSEVCSVLPITLQFVIFFFKSTFIKIQNYVSLFFLLSCGVSTHYVSRFSSGGRDIPLIECQCLRSRDAMEERGFMSSFEAFS